jgi:hypothetical protein
VTIIFKRIFKFDWEEVKSIGLAEDGDSLLELVNTVMKFWFHKGGGGRYFGSKRK